MDEKVDVIVFEARGDFGIIPYREQNGTLRMFLDSPLQNIVDAGRLAARLAEKGHRVIAYGQIDGSTSYYRYNFPRTLEARLKADAQALIESGKAKPVAEKLAQLYGVEVDAVLKNFGDAYAYGWWIENAPFVVRLNERYERLKKKKGDIPGPLREFFASNIIQEVYDFNPSYLSYGMETSALDLKKQMEKDLKVNSLNMYHSRVARYVFEYTVRTLLEKHRNMKEIMERISLHFMVAPTQTIDEWNEISRALEPLLNAFDPKVAFKSLMSSFSSLSKRFGTTHRNSVPLFVETHGFFSSSIISNIKKGKIEIKTEFPLSSIVSSSLAYKYFPNELLQLIRDKGKDNLVAIKYPLLIVDTLVQILSFIKGRVIVKSSKVIQEIAARSLENGSFDAMNMIEALILEHGLKGKINSLYFVEGDGSREKNGTLGPLRVNEMTGAAFDRALERIAKAMGGIYERLVSLPREGVERGLSEPMENNHPPVISYRRMIKLLEQGGKPDILVVRKKGPEKTVEATKIKALLR